MPQRITTETHEWVAAACIPVDPKTAKRSVDRQSIRTYMLPQDLKIEVLDTYCKNCRRPWEDVAGERCEAADSNEHLRGGPIGERQKRAHEYHDCREKGCYVEGSDGELVDETADALAVAQGEIERRRSG